VDHVPRVLADLDAVPDFERTPRNDVEPPRDVRNHVLESDRDTGGEEPEEGGRCAEARDPHMADQDRAERDGDVAGALAPAVPRPRIADLAVDERQTNRAQRPETRDDEESAEEPV